MQRLGRIVGLLSVVMMLLAVPALFGAAVDRQLGSAPWALVTGSLLGVSVATFVIISITLRGYDNIAPRGPGEDG